MLARGEIVQRVRAGTDIVVVISEIRLRPDHADLELASAPALADARIEQRAFAARIGADDEQRIGLVDAGDSGIEDVGAAASLGVEDLAALHRHIGGAEFCQQLFQREHFLNCR